MRKIISLGPQVGGLVRRKSPADRVARLLTPAALSYRYYDAALSALMFWTKGTVFGGRVRVNQPLKPMFINLYLVNHNHLRRKAPSLLNNCCTSREAGP